MDQLVRRRDSKEAGMNALVILNPTAGEDANATAREALRRHFAGAGIEYEVRETRQDERPGDIVRARMRDDVGLVVAAGGDGTVSAVIEGLAGSDVPLGIIPIGTQNMLAREVDIPLGIEEAVALLAGKHRERKIDALRIGTRLYVLNASVGISASIIGGTTPANKGRFGRLAYWWTGFRKMFSMKSRTLRVSVDGDSHTYDAVEVSVENCGILARTLAPDGGHVRVDDGHLDVWILSRKRFRDYPRYLLGVITGQITNLRVRVIHAEHRVSIRSAVPLPVQGDGDIIGTTPIVVEVMPSAITVVVPEAPATPPEAAPG